MYLSSLQASMHRLIHLKYSIAIWEQKEKAGTSRAFWWVCPRCVASIIGRNIEHDVSIHVSMYLVMLDSYHQQVNPTSRADISKRSA